ncbi:MAG: sulfatase-like hydrolase/transferase [Akkermansia sp.]
MAGKFNPEGYEKTSAKRKDYIAECMAAYAAQIAIMDRGIGRILASLERHRLGDNAIVMFLSDNGATAKCPRTIKTRRLPSPQAHWEKSDAGTDTAPCGRLCPIPLTASIK